MLCVFPFPFLGLLSSFRPSFLYVCCLSLAVSSIMFSSGASRVCCCVFCLCCCDFLLSFFVVSVLPCFLPVLRRFFCLPSSCASMLSVMRVFFVVFPPFYPVTSSSMSSLSLSFRQLLLCFADSFFIRISCALFLAITRGILSSSPFILSPLPLFLPFYFLAFFFPLSFCLYYLAFLLFSSFRRGFLYLSVACFDFFRYVGVILASFSFIMSLLILLLYSPSLRRSFLSLVQSCILVLFFFLHLAAPSFFLVLYSYLRPLYI